LMTAALRSFLQYAHYTGLINIDLRSSVPTVASWSMASLPQALPRRTSTPSCPLRSAHGGRASQWAILLAPAWGCVPGRWSAWRSRISIGKRGSCGFGHTQAIGIGCRCPRMWERPWSTICVMRARTAPRGGCSFA
jgi:hypothetical protein